MGATVPQWVTNARGSVLAENNSQRRWSVFFTTATASLLQVSTLCWLISLLSHEWDNEVLYTRPQEEECSSASQDFVKYSIRFSYGESFLTCVNISVCVRAWGRMKEGDRGRVQVCLCLQMRFKDQTVQTIDFRRMRRVILRKCGITRNINQILNTILQPYRHFPLDTCSPWRWNS